MLAGVALVHGKILFTWPFWLDEYHTLFVAERGSLARSMSDLAAGADFNPPLLYVIDRLISSVTGGLTPVSMRIESFVTIWLALVVVFVTLRRILSPSAAFIGAFAVWSHELTVVYAFVGRFYGPWLLLAALTVWSIGLDAERDTSRKRDIALAVSSVLVCTIHYFGIFSLVLMALGAAAWILGNGKSLRRLAPMLAGPAALALCTPFYLGQRAALTVKTWIPNVAPYQLREMLGVFALRGPLVVCAVALVVSAGWSFYRSRRLPSLPWRSLTALPLLALLAMPLMVYAISLFVQPFMKDRYAIVAVLGWAVIAGFAATTLPRPGKAILLGVLFLYSIKVLSARVAQVKTAQMTIEAEAASVKPYLDAGLSVVVPKRFSLYPLAAATSQPTRLLYPDFTDSTAHARRFSAEMILERDVARVHHRLYGFPSLFAVDAPRGSADIYVLLPIGVGTDVLPVWFPAEQIREVAPGMYRLTPR